MDQFLARRERQSHRGIIAVPVGPLRTPLPVSMAQSFREHPRKIRSERSLGGATT